MPPLKSSGVAAQDEDVIEITLSRNDTEGLGFNIRGGHDMPHIAEDTGIFVTKIRGDGAAALDGRLSEGDKILEINGQSLENLSHRTAVTMFKRAGSTVRLKVLKNAEKKVEEATAKRVNPKNTRSKAVLLIGIGAAVALGFTLYKCKDNLKSLLHRILPTSQGRLEGFTYQPYKSKYY